MPTYMKFIGYHKATKRVICISDFHDQCKINEPSWGMETPS